MLRQKYSDRKDIEASKKPESMEKKDLKFATYYCLCLCGTKSLVQKKTEPCFTFVLLDLGWHLVLNY